jgi:UDP-N-acetylglucosamine acyltransferase
MSTRIHPSALVEAGAQLGEGVQVGAFAVIEAGAVVGDGTQVGHHAVIHAGVTLGRDNRIFPHAVVGGDPQDLKYAGQKTTLVIGDANQIREYTTLQRGTEEGGGVTRIGSRNLFMAYTHVAHDCVLGDEIVMANCATVAGHCFVGSRTVVGGLSGLHQHARIGTGAMVGALSRLSKDVPPYSTTSGCDEVKVYGLNKIGLKRRGMPKDDVAALEEAYRIYLDRSINFSEALARLEALTRPAAPVQELIDFLKSSSRGVYR